MTKRVPGLSLNARSLKTKSGGYRCSCGHRTATIDARTTEHGFRRRRECPGCGNRITTYEIQIQGGDDFFQLARYVSRDGLCVLDAVNRLNASLQNFQQFSALQQKINGVRHNSPDQDNRPIVEAAE